MKVRHDMTITVNTDANKNRTVFIPSGCEYPVTKEEGVEKLSSSALEIICELTYMLGCIRYLKASFLRPDSKNKWFDLLLKAMDNIEEIRDLLDAHPVTAVSEDDIPF